MEKLWLMAYGQQKGWRVEVDGVGNVLMRIKVTRGKEVEKWIILQTHMDMVDEKLAEVKHDFTKDPIEVEEENGWLKTKGETTLGADNGVGMAIALYVAEYLPHPPMGLLFTIDEETGLTGAQALKKGWLQFKQLINL